MERIEKLRQFIQSSPEDSFLHHALALEYIKLGEDETARQIFESLLEKDPGYVGSYYHLGKLLERKENIEGALKWYEKGMEKAKVAGDNHAYNELKAAYEELAF